MGKTTIRMANNKFLNYMELSKNSKLNEYKQYFPEDNQVFTEYYNKFLESEHKILLIDNSVDKYIFSRL